MMHGRYHRNSSYPPPPNINVRPGNIKAGIGNEHWPSFLKLSNGSCISSDKFLFNLL